jgi:molybdopterin-guanine dinucleotide biosynthesis protein A
MPFVSAAFLGRLAEEVSADAVIPHGHHGYEPLCAIYSRACAPEIRARLGRGELQASVPPAGVRLVEIGPEIIANYDPHGLIFTNINTPHDYERARELLGLSVDSNHEPTEDRITSERSRT